MRKERSKRKGQIVINYTSVRFFKSPASKARREARRRARRIEEARREARQFRRALDAGRRARRQKTAPKKKSPSYIPAIYICNLCLNIDM